MNDLAERARSKKLKARGSAGEHLLHQPTRGVFGGLFGLPVISQPNVGILGLGAIEKRPVVINDSIAIRSMCYVTLSYDHRVVDGAIATSFCTRSRRRWKTGTSPYCKERSFRGSGQEIRAAVELQVRRRKAPAQGSFSFQSEPWPSLTVRIWDGRSR